MDVVAAAVSFFLRAQLSALEHAFGKDVRRRRRGTFIGGPNQPPADD